MNNQFIAVHTANARIGNSLFGTQRNILKEGDSVYVKIISDKGNGVYEGSVAGNRVNITSSKALNVGSSFIATVSAKNGTIFITPKENIAETKSFINLNVIENNNIANILQNLGLPVNNLSSNLLKMMMELEMKIDNNILRNLYSLASKHKGREKAAGELIMALKDKGISISQEELDELLDYLEFYGNNNEADFSRQENNNKKEKSLINKTNKIKGGWFIFPYNIVDISTDNIIGAGILRLQFNKYNILKMINFNCFYNSKKYLFNLIFEMGKCKEINFNIEQGEKIKDKLVNQLSTYFNNEIQINWCESNLIEGFASEGKKIYTFDGEA